MFEIRAPEERKGRLRWHTRKQAVPRATVAIPNPSALASRSSAASRVIAGNIIIRQRGTKWHPGANVGMGKDHTLFALDQGVVSFARKANGRTYVSVAAMAEASGVAGFPHHNTGNPSRGPVSGQPGKTSGEMGPPSPRFFVLPGEEDTMVLEKEDIEDDSRLLIDCPVLVTERLVLAPAA